MKQRRFLVCYILGDMSKGSLVKYYKVSEGCTFKEVSLPNHTFMFFFMHTEMSKKELEGAYVGIQFQNQKVIDTSRTEYTIDDNRIYFRGKPGFFNGHLGCIGEDIFIPVSGDTFGEDLEKAIVDV